MVNSMIGKMGIWAGLMAVVVVALMFGTVANSVAHPAPPTTTYTVKITETGIPSGTSWTVYFDGVYEPTQTASTMTITGVAAGSSYVYTYDIAGTSNIQYVPYYNGYTYFTVPNQENFTMSYHTQYYTTFDASPSGSGTAYPGTSWQNAGSEVALSAAAASGYTFSKWSGSPKGDFTFSSTKTAQSEVAISGVGTITATFKSKSTSETFDQVGLPSATSWSVTFDSASSSGTGASITTGAHPAGGYSWSVAPVTISSTVQYAAQPASGYLTLPTQASQEIVFVKQFSVTFTATPTSTGTVSPSGTSYYTNGSVFPLLAAGTSSYVFSKWSGNETKVGLGNTANAGTNATVKGSTTITATFKSGTTCTTCSLTFNEVGLPSGAGWGVTFNSINYASSTGSLTISGITAGESYQAFEPVSAGVFGEAYIPAYIGTAYTGNGYYTLGATTSIEIVYTEYAYVTVAINPYQANGAINAFSTGWYSLGDTYAISAVGSTTWTFASWSSSGSNLTIGSTSSSSTTLTVTGSGTITLNMKQATSALHFYEYGLVAHTTWGVTFNSVLYTGSGNEINVTGVAYNSYSWSPLTSIAGTASGTLYTPLSYSSSVDAPYQTVATVVYAEQVYVSFATSSNTGGGTTSPSTPGWYWVGTVLPINVENGTTPFFTSWSDTAGTGTITTPTLGSTFVTIAGTGTVTAKF
ncbi:MAG: hypothetical protein L3J92_04790 [Thermoplasmata archaeon]|jgi:hypothetical protein|nr:hypothetical protein [Thermoplasmata archaeon]